jgi:tetratricopeptide (TPR) repeat protein
MLKTLVDGRFEIQSLAGSGGMGTVYRALDRLEGGPVAVKLLRGDGDPTDEQRFERECALLAELRHPGIVRHLAHGVTSRGEHYLVLEWLEGETLERRLARKRLTPFEGLSLARKLTAALAVAHAHGVVHRDIKPSNIVLVGRVIDRLKLIDFGIAHALHDARRLTLSGMLIGTPGYMAPEQVRRQGRPDPRSDVFSLGCVIFEALVGRPVFEGAHAMAILAKILVQAVPLLRAVRPDAPEAVEALLARLLAKRAAERPCHAGELLAALEEVDAVWRAWAAADETRCTRRPDPPSRGRDSITHHEQRIVSVVLGTPLGASASATQERLASGIERHGGLLAVLADGSMMVTIWSGGSAADRAERAALCALYLKGELPGAAICVVTGRGVVSARVVEGDVIEQGARALGAARSGSVILNTATAGLLGTRFDIVRSGDALELRGENRLWKTAPTLLGKPMPCLGRMRELSILEGLLSATAEEPRASAVIATGAPGTGKSRIRRELGERLRKRGRPVEILCGWADSLGEGAPFGLLADAIRRAAGIQGDEPLEERCTKLAARLGRRLSGDALVHAMAFLGELTRTPFLDDEHRALQAARDDPRLMGDAMRVAFQAWLTAECAAQPVLLVLEDLQWGDAATVQLVDATLRNLRELPLMVLALARPEVYSRFPSLWSERDAHFVRLSPLPRKASEQLARLALGEAVGADVVARIVELADGNPFYLEELIRVVAAGRTDDFPDTILGMVEARLDAEGAEAKRILRAASVFGDRFSQQGVAALLGGEQSFDDAGAWLQGLVDRELVTRVAASADPLYTFRHALVRETAYAALTDADRALGHRLAGAWLEKSPYADTLAVAEHFRRGQEPARAVRWYLRASKEALDANDLAAVIERAERGIACGASREDLGLLHLVSAEAHLWRGQLAHAEQRGSEAVALLPPGSDGWFEAVCNVVIATGKRGAFDEVERWALEALAQRQRGVASALVLCLGECASYLVFGGRYAMADVVLAALSRGEGLDARVLAKIEEARAIRASAAGDQAACLSGLEAALAAFEEAGDHRNACVTRSNLGFSYADLGDFERAEAALRAALSATDRLGLHDVEAAALHNLGYTLAFEGKIDEARSVEQRAVDAFERLGDPRLLGLSHTYLARIHLLAGDHAGAQREARAAADLLLAARPLRAGAIATLARALLAEGRAGEALPLAAEAFALLSSLGTVEEGESLVRLVHAEALAASGDEPGFRRAIASAHEDLLARAAKISDPAWRARFLSSVPDNARTAALAQQDVLSPSSPTPVAPGT